MHNGLLLLTERKSGLYINSLLAFLMLLCGFLLPGIAQGQAVEVSEGDTSDSTYNHITVEGWVERTQLFMLDRAENWGPFTYDRGLFRRYQPDIYREYEMDMMFYRYSMEDQHDWYSRGSAVRLWAGSVKRAKLGNELQLKYDWRAGKNVFHIDGYMYKNLRANRSLVNLEYRRILSDHHTIGLSHTLNEHKIDLDLTGYYEFSNAWIDRARASVTVNDLYHDLINMGLGVPYTQEEIRRDYWWNLPTFEVAFQSSSAMPLRVEVFGGIRPESEFTHMRKTDPDFYFKNFVTSRYAALSVSYNWQRWLFGAFHKRRYNRLYRTGMNPKIESDYTTRQKFRSYGVYLKFTRDPWTARAQYAIEHYTDRQHGDNFQLSTIPGPMDLDEYLGKLRLDLSYHFPDSDWRVGGAYLITMWSQEPFKKVNEPGTGSDILARNWTQRWFRNNPYNYRAVFNFSKDLPWGILEFGIGYDIDGDVQTHYDQGELIPGENPAPARYDGAYGRILLDL